MSKPKMILNPDEEYVRDVRKRLKDNGGYCPCQLERTPDTKCRCKDFRESGVCVCRLFVPEGPQEFDFDF